MTLQKILEDNVAVEITYGVGKLPSTAITISDSVATITAELRAALAKGARWSTRDYEKGWDDAAKAIEQRLGVKLT